MTTGGYPLDLERTGYAYVERPNSVLVRLVEEHVLSRSPNARLLDVGCGAGANAQALKRAFPGARLLGIEPNARAAELAREVMDEVFHGTLDEFLSLERDGRWDAVILSDVVEHVVDPVGLLRSLAQHPATRGAVFVVSVPNYAVWYNRINAVFGRFRYGWSGLYDRTHLRFFTRSSFQELLRHCGLRADVEQCSPSLVQSAAPVLRRLFDSDVEQGRHRTLAEAPLFQAYRSFVEPLEQVACSVWPELLGFQLVSVARVDPR